MIFKCPKHDISASIEIGRNLKATIETGNKVSHLISIIYDFIPGDAGGTIEYFFSPEEAVEYNIHDPGVIITFNMDNDEDPPDPYEKAKKNMTIMCYKCLEDVYKSELSELKNNRNKYKILKLG